MTKSQIEQLEMDHKNNAQLIEEESNNLQAYSAWDSFDAHWIASEKYSIINLTQHKASEDQRSEGVFDSSEVSKEFEAEVKRLLTFDELPYEKTIWQRAMAIADYCKDLGVKTALIGGAPFFMGPLAEVLKSRGVDPLFSFSKRESVEKEVDGKTVKTSVFKHVGFVPA
jgi:hypothetical protein